jgi:hypothetical protein
VPVSFLNKGTPVTPPDENQLDYSYGYGGGGSSGPSEQTKKYAALQKPLAAAGAKIQMDYNKNMGDVYDDADQFAKESAAAQKANLLRATTSEWFPSLVRTQAAFKAQKKKMGNGGLASGLKDSIKDTQKAYDVNQGSLLNGLMANLNDIVLDEYNTLQRNRNAKNELIAQTIQTIGNQGVEYASNLANLDPGFVNGDEDGWGKIVEPSDKGKGGNYNADLEQTLKMFGLQDRINELKMQNPYQVQRLMGTIVYPSNMQRSLPKQSNQNSQSANKGYWSRND